MILNNNTKHIATIKKVYYPSGNTNYCLILSQTHKALKWIILTLLSNVI